MAKSVRGLKGKVAVLAGATDGIGYAIADRLAEDGAKVMISSRKQVNVETALKSLQGQYGNESVSGVVCHVGKDEDRKRLIEESIKKFGRIDILVDNAGISPVLSLSTINTSHREWMKMFEVNVVAAALLVKEAYPYLKETKGSVMFVASAAAYVLDRSYGVTKTAQVALTKALARELGPDGIRVNCISPGLVKTKFGKVAWSSEELLKLSLNRQWIQKLTLPEECAGIAAFLCSDEASMITGESVQIGGFSSRL